MDYLHSKCGTTHCVGARTCAHPTERGNPCHSWWYFRWLWPFSIVCSYVASHRSSNPQSAGWFERCQSLRNNANTEEIRRFPRLGNVSSEIERKHNNLADHFVENPIWTIHFEWNLIQLTASSIVALAWSLTHLTLSNKYNKKFKCSPRIASHSTFERRKSSLCVSAVYDANWIALHIHASTGWPVAVYLGGVSCEFDDERFV